MPVALRIDFYSTSTDKFLLGSTEPLINKKGKDVEEWVEKALARWPNVPTLYGWLGLDRRGRWLIRGEVISRPQIIETINQNYAVDEFGAWYFQNGPQRGYVDLVYAPLVLRVGAGAQLLTHTEQLVMQCRAAYLDEEGSLLLMTEHGPGVIADGDLAWALNRFEKCSNPVAAFSEVRDDAVLDVIEQMVESALAQPTGAATQLGLRLDDALVPIQRLDSAQMPSVLGFIRTPSPVAMPAETMRLGRAL